MKALSLTQPWASLVSIGRKSVETRSWGTSYRGLLAIHAAKTFPRDYRELVMREPCRSALEAGGIPVPYGTAEIAGDLLPRGAVVAVVRLTACRRTSGISTRVPTPWVQNLSVQEHDFGDYGPSRYGWFLELVERLPEPIPAKGALGLWEWDAPARVADLLGERLP